MHICRLNRSLDYARDDGEVVYAIASLFRVPLLTAA